MRSYQFSLRRWLPLVDMKKTKTKLKDCFGNQARDMLFGDPPDKCADCDLFSKCHKITIAACLQSISDGLDLIVQNGLATEKLMSWKELNELAEKEQEKEKIN